MTVNHEAGYTIVARAAPAGPPRVQSASGGIDDGGATVGAVVGRAVGVAVGRAVGVAVGRAVGEALGLTVGDAVGADVASPDVSGVGSAGGSGRDSATTTASARSRRMTELPRRSMMAAPWSAARTAVSWAMTSSAQAIFVVASRPILTIVPFVP